jgi:hypothetical protein
MEQLYYILDTSTNTIVVENLTHSQAMKWFTQSGSVAIHILIEQ